MSIFKFKHFQVNQSDSAMKIGTDAMVFGALIDASGKTSALDIGTGTGVLSLMVAQKDPELHITAVEIETRAASEAKQNFKDSPFHAQIEIVNGDFLQMDPASSFDLIFSNPPYFENSSKSGVDSRDLARHDDHLPLNLLFSKAASLLSADGHFWVILPHLTMDQYYPEAASSQLFPQTEISIYGKENQLVRKITAFSRTQAAINKKHLVVRNPDGTYTNDYKELTEMYHFNALK